MAAVVCICRVSVNGVIVAAGLISVGYSAGATLLIFDRIRENTADAPRGEKTKADFVDKSVKEAQSRNLVIAIAIILALVCLFIFGAQPMKEFAISAAIGVLTGLYCSLYLTPTFWIKLDAKFGGKKKRGVKAIR